MGSLVAKLPAPDSIVPKPCDVASDTADTTLEGNQDLNAVLEAMKEDVSTQNTVLSTSIADIQCLKVRMDSVGLAETSAHGLSDLDAQIDTVDASFLEFVDFSEHKQRELQDTWQSDLSALACRVDVSIADMSTVLEKSCSRLDRMQAAMDANLGDGFKDLVLRTLQAAITPMAEILSKKIRDIEAKLFDPETGT